MRVHLNIGIGLVLLGCGVVVGGLAPFWDSAVAGDGKPAQPVSARGAVDPVKPVSATLSNWKIGRVYELDGVSDHVRVEDYPELRPAALTISAWIYTSDALLMQPIVAKAQGKGNWNSFMLRIQDKGRVSLSVDNLAAGQDAHWRTEKTLASKRWYHVAATWANTRGDATDAKIYIDGVAQEITMNRNVGYGPAFRIAYTAEPLYIGRDEMPSGHFVGTIKNIDIFDRVLTAAEIKGIADR